MTAVEAQTRLRQYADQTVPRLAVVVSGWPRVSETFAQNELLALAASGMLTAIFATKAGDPSLVQPHAERLDRLVEFLPEGSEADQGAWLAARLQGTGVRGVHGYFAHRPAAVARIAAEGLGVPFSFSVHALDARKVSPGDLASRSRAATAVIACNHDVAAELAHVGYQATLLPHGVDLSWFVPSTPVEQPVVQLLAVGRLVAKKGFDTLLQAMALVRVATRLRIVGDGPLADPLAEQITRLGLGDRVELVGRRTHHELPALYASCDIVVVPSVVDAGGDRDGLPNVVLEAMASGRPVIASDVAAVASAVRHAETGTLVAPGNAEALAAAIARLGADRARRLAFGAAGRLTVERHFDLTDCAERFCAALKDAYV